MLYLAVKVINYIKDIWAYFLQIQIIILNININNCINHFHVKYHYIINNNIKLEY